MRSKDLLYSESSNTINVEIIDLTKDDDYFGIRTISYPEMTTTTYLKEQAKGSSKLLYKSLFIYLYP